MIPAALEPVEELRSVTVASCRPLGRGLSNRSWHVTSEAGAWVVRLNGDAAGVDRRFECRVLALAAARDLGPAVVACRPDAGYLVTEFLPQPAWSRAAFDDPRAVADLARSLRELHGISDPGAEAVDWRGELAARVAAGPLRDQTALKDGIARLMAALDGTGFDSGPLALCHHDLHVGNILGTDPVRFVDFEYARWTHPAMDVAWLIQYHDLVPEQVDLLLGAYYGRSGRDAVQFIALAVRLAQYQELLWLAELQAAGRLPPALRSRLRALTVVLA